MWLLAKTSSSVVKTLQNLTISLKNARAQNPRKVNGQECQLTFTFYRVMPNRSKMLKLKEKECRTIVERVPLREQTVERELSVRKRRKRENPTVPLRAKSHLEIAKDQKFTWTVRPLLVKFQPTTWAAKSAIPGQAHRNGEKVKLSLKSSRWWAKITHEQNL